MSAEPEFSVISYEDLAAIEDDFEAIDTEIMRTQYSLSKTAYAKRAAAIEKIPTFWPLVLEQAPMEIDQFIQSQDSRIFGEHLTDFQVSRPELEDGAKGNPRSLKIRFTFGPNDDFENEVLEKTFWYRRAADGWTGLVSEPVKINWKKDKDLTEGLTDAAAALFEARQKVGDMKATGLPEYAALQKKVEHWNGMNTSFFTWFGWVSSRRYVTAEESEKANAETAAKKEARKNGAKDEEEDYEEGDDEAEDDDAVEVHQAGEELAISFAEEVWPNAIKLFTEAQEMDEISDAEFEDDDEDDEDDDEEPIDIASLIESTKGDKARGKSDGGPPSKKAKK